MNLQKCIIKVLHSNEITTGKNTCTNVGTPLATIWTQTTSFVVFSCHKSCLIGKKQTLTSIKTCPVCYLLQQWFHRHFHISNIRT